MKMKTISKRLTEILINAYDEDCNEYIQLREGYSGRYMYGSSCIGFVINDISVFHAISDMYREIRCYDEIEKIEFYDDLREFEEMLAFAEQDNMGIGKILYFPGYKLNEEYFKKVETFNKED